MGREGKGERDGRESLGGEGEGKGKGEERENLGGGGRPPQMFFPRTAPGRRHHWSKASILFSIALVMDHVSAPYQRCRELKTHRNVSDAEFMR